MSTTLGAGDEGGEGAVALLDRLHASVEHRDLGRIVLNRLLGTR